MLFHHLHVPPFELQVEVSHYVVLNDSLCEEAWNIVPQLDLKLVLISLFSPKQLYLVFLTWCNQSKTCAIFLLFNKKISFLEELDHYMAEKSPAITDIKRCLEICEISCSVLHLTSALGLFLTQNWESSPLPPQNLKKFVHALKLNTSAIK